MELSLFECCQIVPIMTYTHDIIYFSRYSLGQKFHFNQVGQKPK